MNRKYRLRKLDYSYLDTWITRSKELKKLKITTYTEYLKSSIWKEIKDKAQTRPHYQKCFLCGSFENIELHHRRYKFLHLSILRNIIPLCENHHEQVHSLAKTKQMSVGRATGKIIKRWKKEGNKLSWTNKENL